MLTQLPRDVLLLILNNLEVADLRKIAAVCTVFRNLSSDKIVWQHQLKTLSSIDDYRLQPKLLVRAYTRLLKQSGGFFKGFAETTQDFKNLILQSPKIREKLSDEDAKEIMGITKFIS